MRQLIYILIICGWLANTLTAQIDYQCGAPMTSTTTLSNNSRTYPNLTLGVDPYQNAITSGFNTSNRHPFDFKSIKAFIKVDFGDSNPWGKEQFQIDITNLNLVINKNSFLNSGPILIPSQNQNLILDQDNPEQKMVVTFSSSDFPNNFDLANIYDLTGGNGDMFDITVQPTINVSQLSNVTAQEVANKLRFTLCYEIEYEIDAVTTDADQIPETNTPSQVGNSKQYTFSWENEDKVWFPAYELQILRLFNSKDHDPISQEDIETTVDWSRALSFAIPEDQLDKNSGDVYSKVLTLSEFTGYYAWRVRAIGSKYEGGAANNRNWGVWDQKSSNFLANGTTISLNNLGELSGQSYTGSVFFFRDPDEAKGRNTIYSRVFTEGGKTHEGMSYADGLLKSRQSQSYLPSNPTNNTVITQQFYDHVGRSAISTLPVPTNNNLNGYQERFAKDMVNQGLYTVDNFDKQGKEATPDEMSLKGADPSATDYYSDEGVDPYVDNAQGYPFSISRYSNDGLDNVEQQSGVGKRHMIGDVNSEMGRTTRKNYTADVAADELLRIFGAEAPDHKTVTKETTTDPNGTESISYIDKNGKLLATCLSFNSDLNNALENLDGANSSFPVLDLMKASELTTEGFVSTKRLFFTEDDNDLKISYIPDAGVCSGFMICGTQVFCDVDFTLFVANIEAPNVNLAIDPNYISGTPANFPLSSFDICTNTPYVLELENLPKGDYIIKKILKAVDTNPDPNSPQIQALIQQEIAKREAALNVYTELVTVILANIDEPEEIANDVFIYAMDCVENFAKNTSTPTTVSTLETCLTALSLDMTAFDFDQLNDINIDLSIITDLELDSNGDIAIGFDDCGAGLTPLSINADIDILIPPCIGGPNYTYRGVGPYELPPFLEYFVDRAWNPLATYVESKYTDANGNISPTNLGLLNTELNAYAEALFPGYGIDAATLNSPILANDNNFNKMIWHMLNDKYFCGQVQWNAVDGRYDVVESDGTLTPYDATIHETMQYNCKQLWSCWETNVASISNMLQFFDDPNVGGDIDIFGTIEANDETNGADTEEHIENNISWFLRLFLGETDPYAGFKDDPTFTDDNGNAIPITEEEMEFENLTALFLDCTGYRYARLVDPRVAPNATTATSYINTQQVHRKSGTAGVDPTTTFNTLDIPLIGNYDNPKPTSITGTDEIEEYYNSRLANNTPLDNDKFRHTHSPIFAFKYYEYYHLANPGLPSKSYTAWADFYAGLGLTPTSFPFVGGELLDAPAHYPSCEIALEYPYPDGIIPTILPCDIPENPDDIGHDEWTCGRRYDFLECLRNRQELSIDPNNLSNPPQNPNSSSLTLATATDCADQALIYNSTTSDDPLTTSCKATCESRRAEFKTAVMAALTKRCYIIGECPDCGPEYISNENVDALVDQLVAVCEGQCDANALAGGTSSCTLADGTVVNSCELQVGTPCQNYLIEQVRSWTPEVDFPSMCSGNTTDPNHLELIHQAQNGDDEECPATPSFSTPAPTEQTSKVKKITQTP